MEKFNKSPIPLFLHLVLFLFLVHGDCFAWGFLAHKMINRKAVEALPEELRPFFEQHIKYIIEHSIDPDLWRNKNPDESVRHYIDIDMYGSYPFKELPHSFEAAKQKFGEETLYNRGIAPWWVIHCFNQLVTSMKQGDPRTIIANAAVLGHYVADLFMPLHTIENYDGQLTDNQGIHSRFESWMIEEYASYIKLKVHEATPIDDPLSFIFEVILKSYQFANDILAADTRSKNSHKSYKERDDYDKEYLSSLFNLVGNLAESRMSEAASAISSFWYTAWIKARKPQLPLNGRK